MTKNDAVSKPFMREGHTVSLLLSVEEAVDSFVPNATTLRLSLSVITLTPEEEGQKPRNVWSLDEWHNGLMMGSLVIKGTGYCNRGYNSQGDPDGTVSRRMDAFRVQYAQPYSVELREAEAMVKTLRVLDRKLRAVQMKDGYAEDFPAYVRRVAQILGIDQITFPTERSAYSSYDNGSYRTLPLEAGLYHLETLISPWMKGETVPGVVHHSR